MPKMTNVSRVLAIFRQEEAGKGGKTMLGTFGNIPGAGAGGNLFGRNLIMI